MYTKQLRFNLVQLVFNFIFRHENQLSHDLEDVLLQTTTDEEKIITSKIIDNFETYKDKITPHLHGYGWDKTPFLSRSILITFLMEFEETAKADQTKEIAEYLHLTQDLAGADSVSLVHAVIGKIVGVAE
jgi:transcription termination factor NusB